MSDVRTQVANEIVRASREGAPVSVATVLRAPEGADIRMGDKLLVSADGSRLGSIRGAAFGDVIAADCLAAITTRPRVDVETLYYTAAGERLQRLEAGAGEIEVMIEVVERAATLLIVGGGHVGQAIASIASIAGFSVAVLDDRAAFASEERFPTADKVICGDFVEELRKFPIDANTYVIMVSRGHKQDELALREVAASVAAYVGMIGSLRRVSTVLTHLAQEGVPRAALESVHTPIGLDIGAETPEEIAVSVVAELVLVRRGGTGRKLSELRRARIRD